MNRGLDTEGEGNPVGRLITGAYVLKNLGGVRKTIMSGVLKTIADGSFLSFQKTLIVRVSFTYRSTSEYASILQTHPIRERSKKIVAAGIA